MNVMMLEITNNNDSYKISNNDIYYDIYMKLLIF